MIKKYFKFIGISLMLLIFLAGMINFTFASMNMDELQEKFKQETGKQWSEVTSEERSDFMYEIRGGDKKEERKKRIEGVTTPFYIRERFRKEKKMQWEDATEEEQESFVQEFKKLRKKLDQEQAKTLKDKEFYLKKKEREKKQAKKELIKKKKERQRKADAKRKALKKKRKDEKKRLKDSMKDRNALLRLLKSKHGRH